MQIALKLDGINYKLPISYLHTLAEALLLHFSGEELKTIITYEHDPLLFFANSSACLDASMLWAHQAENFQLESYEYACKQWQEAEIFITILNREHIFCSHIEKTLILFLYKQYKKELPPFSEILTLYKNYPSTLDNPHHIYSVLMQLAKEYVQ